MRDQLADHPLFTQHRERWEDMAAPQPLRWLPKTDHYANKYMVEVVAVLETRRSGLASNVTGSALADGDRAERLAVRVLDDVAPTIARQASTRVAGAPALVLSDPSNDALAYHALTLGLLRPGGRACSARAPRRGPARRSSASHARRGR